MRTEVNENTKRSSSRTGENKYLKNPQGHKYFLFLEIFESSFQAPPLPSPQFFFSFSFSSFFSILDHDSNNFVFSFGAQVGSHGARRRRFPVTARGEFGEQRLFRASFGVDSGGRHADFVAGAAVRQRRLRLEVAALQRTLQTNATKHEKKKHRITIDCF